MKKFKEKILLDSLHKLEDAERNNLFSEQNEDIFSNHPEETTPSIQQQVFVTKPKKHSLKQIILKYIRKSFYKKLQIQRQLFDKRLEDKRKNLLTKFQKLNRKLLANDRRNQLLISFEQFNAYRNLWRQFMSKYVSLCNNNLFNDYLSELIYRRKLLEKWYKFSAFLNKNFQMQNYLFNKQEERHIKLLMTFQTIVRKLVAMDRRNQLQFSFDQFNKFRNLWKQFMDKYVSLYNINLIHQYLSDFNYHQKLLEKWYKFSAFLNKNFQMQNYLFNKHEEIRAKLITKFQILTRKLLANDRRNQLLISFEQFNAYRNLWRQFVSKYISLHNNNLFNDHLLELIYQQNLLEKWHKFSTFLTKNHYNNVRDEFDSKLTIQKAASFCALEIFHPNKCIEQCVKNCINVPNFDYSHKIFSNQLMNDISFQSYVMVRKIMQTSISSATKLLTTSASPLATKFAEIQFLLSNSAKIKRKNINVDQSNIHIVVSCCENNEISLYDT